MSRNYHPSDLSALLYPIRWWAATLFRWWAVSRNYHPSDLSGLRPCPPYINYSDAGLLYPIRWWAVFNPVVRYGGDFPKAGYELENDGEPP
ncbi:MAG: hypothetical protein F6K65_33630 [Moorea sp. SIO3C2]|nr:hypothetical protein [Moorena sp. SIO3C2]